MGWGKTNTDVDDSITIVETAAQQKLDLSVVSNQACAQTWNDISENRLNITGDLSLEHHLCAGGEVGKDSCKVNCKCEFDSFGSFLFQETWIVLVLVTIPCLPTIYLPFTFRFS